MKEKITKFILKYKNPRNLPLTSGDIIVGKGLYKDKVAIVYGSCFNDYSVIYLNDKKPVVIGFPWDDWNHIWTKIGKVYDIDLMIKKLGKGYDWDTINDYGLHESLQKIENICKKEKLNE